MVYSTTSMIQSLKGMPDILPDEAPSWQTVEKRLRRILDTYAYQEIRTPMLEDTTLFVRGVGEHTDVVGKEMFTFVDQGGTSMSLRPEGTAPVMRAYQQHQLAATDAFLKLFYIGPMFRHERPQKGRLRQFHQVGAEAIGLFDPWVDVEMITLLMDICKSFDIDVSLEINSMGDTNTRNTYRDIVQQYFRKHADKLSDGEKIRLENNPLRLLDSKNPALADAVASAPSILDHLSSESKKFFEQVQDGLSGVGVKFNINPRIVRGLDYYCHTTFEVTAGGLGAQNSICGGGRYDRLAASLGEKEIPAIGFGLGLERLMICLENKLKIESLPRIEIISLDEKARKTAFQIAQTLRGPLSGKACVDMQFESKSFKAALRLADKHKATWALILGENELNNRNALIKALATGEQANIGFDQLTEYFVGKL